MVPLMQFSRYSALVTFCLGLPTAAATYYQAWKARQEAAEARAGLSYSKNCLEFVLEDGSTVNLVPLDTLHTLPRPGEIVLLPGSHGTAMGAYRVGRIEHIYARYEGAGKTKKADLRQARLIKTVAHVDSLFLAGAVEEVEAGLQGVGDRM